MTGEDWGTGEVKIHLFPQTNETWNVQKRGVQLNIRYFINYCTYAPHHLLLSCTALPQEEELHEIIGKISAQRIMYERAQAEMAEVKASCEEAEQEYKQHKDQISRVAEEADSIKVIL